MSLLIKISSFLFLMLSLTSAFATESQALHKTPQTPVGIYEHQSTEAHSTTHQRIFNKRLSSDRKLLKDYKSFGYNCENKINYFTMCRKKVSTNPNQIEFKVEELKKLAPTFGELTSIHQTNDSTLVSTYEIEQEVFLGESVIQSYTLYHDHETKEFKADLDTSKSNSLRFIFKNKDLLKLWSTEREKLQKNEVLIHRLISYYE